MKSSAKNMLDFCAAPLLNWLCFAPLTAVSLAFSSVAFAQAIAIPKSADISRMRATPLEIPESDYELRIRNAEKTALPKDVEELDFEVTKIQVTGANVFSEAMLFEVFGYLEGRTVKLSEVRAAAEILEDRYHEAGYLLTRVFVPPQMLENGVLKVRVLEGYLENALFRAPNNSSKMAAQAAIQPLIGRRPLKVTELDTKMVLLNELPGLSAKSVLRPGDALGSSRIVVSADKRPNTFIISSSNAGSDAIGPFSVTALASFNQPFGRIGALDLTLTGAGEDLGELKAFSSRYTFASGIAGITASFGGLIAKAKPGGGAAALGVVADSHSIDARLRRALYVSRPNSIYLDAGMVINSSKVSGLGSVLSDDQSSVAELTLSWRQSGFLGGEMTSSLSIFRGIKLFGAYGSDARLPSVKGFEPKFTKWRLTINRRQPLAPKLSAAIKIQAQYTSDRLSSGEQISFGGSAFGRGYDPSTATGDKGFGVLGEVKWDLGSLGMSGTVDRPELYAFGDWASAKTLAYEAEPAQVAKLASLGFGFRAFLFRKLIADVQFASGRKSDAFAISRGDRVLFNSVLIF